MDTRQTPRKESALFHVIRRIGASKLALTSAVVLAIIIFGAVFAGVIAPQNPYDLMQLNIFDNRLPPGAAAGDGSMIFLLGTDDQGRDVFSSILYGLRISLFVGILAAFFSFALGTTLGLLAAYVGGRVENLLMRIVDLQLSFPSILVALMILAVFGPGIINVVLALVFVEWATYARIARSAAIAEKEREYIQAARGQALPGYLILFRHLLPNCLPPLIVVGTMQVARAISLEATLSFLGLGVPITEPSLGLLIANGSRYILTGDYWTSVFPGVTLLVTILSINILGDRIRAVLNPRGYE